MEEITYKDLSQTELENLKDLYIASRLTSMSETDLRSFVKEIIEDQIKGTVGHSEEKEAWHEMKEHFSEDLSKMIEEVKAKNKNKNPQEIKTPEELEFDKRLSLLKRKEEEQNTNSDMW
tara:strand:+ start:1906 stop:2262 length:357 start_codon:yes stop_codon:yes gene_type:complete